MSSAVPFAPLNTAEVSRPALLLAKCAQCRAELARLPALAFRVVPELIVSRFQQRESLVHCLLSHAERTPDARALGMGASWLSYSALARRVERAAAFLELQGVTPGQPVALVGKNSLEYATLLLALARLGAPAALLGSELGGDMLSRAIDRAGCAFVLCDARLRDQVVAARNVPILPFDSQIFETWQTRAPTAVRAPLPGDGSADFAYVFTSGTTGRSRPCRISHRKARLAATAFGRLVHQLTPEDVIYCALPLHHSSALLLGLGASLAAGASLVLRERFSARELSADLKSSQATVLLYVGELGRAWLSQAPSAEDREHRLRLALGNGLNREVWLGLQQRFGVPQIREFFAATEFPGAVVNLVGTPGSVGHLPLGRLRGYRLVRVDADTRSILRDANGRAIECAPNEPGELVLRVKPKPAQPTGAYLGYVGETAGEERVARDLFRAADMYCRTGDLLRRNAAGEYFFVDRLGDTFRFKGHNVSTREVEEVLATAPGVAAVAVVGVSAPHVEGKLGLALLELGPDFSWASFAVTCERLPSYARPTLVRVVKALTYTESLKLKKRAAADEGFDPARILEPLYYRQGPEFLPLQTADYERFQSGLQRV